MKDVRLLEGLGLGADRGARVCVDLCCNDRAFAASSAVARPRQQRRRPVLLIQGCLQSKDAACAVEISALWVVLAGWSFHRTKGIEFR